MRLQCRNGAGLNRIEVGSDRIRTELTGWSGMDWNRIERYAQKNRFRGDFLSICFSSR